MPFHSLCRYFYISHIILANQILLLVFSASANATESDKRDLMKELDTIKLLKPRPYVIKLLDVLQNLVSFGYAGLIFQTHFASDLLCDAFSSLIICFNGGVTASQLSTTNRRRIRWFYLLLANLDAPAFTDRLGPNICH